MRKYYLRDLKKVIKIKKFIGDNKDYYFTNAKSIEEADEDSVVWIKSAKENKLDLINQTKAKFIICDLVIDENELRNSKKLLFIVENPKLEYIRVVRSFFEQKPDWLIHKSSIVHPEAELHKDVYIGPNCVIGRCQIDKGTVILGNCFIHDKVIIGKNVKINANTVIGSEGFSYTKLEEGNYELFPHIGGVIIENNVDIGSNTNINRGVLGNTIIKQGVKIANLVHIAHNVVIGMNSVIISNAMLGGSVVIGHNSWISPSVSIINQAVIGDNVKIGMGAVVTKNIPNNEIWAGIPARPLDQLIQQQNIIKKL